MPEKKIKMTKEGLEELKAELLRAETTGRSDVAAKLKEARAQGDLSENAEYDAAMDEQGKLEARILELKEILNNAEVASESEIRPGVVSIGSIVTALDMEYNEEERFQIVGSTEAKSLEHKISTDSPLGVALFGAKEGDVVTVEAPAGSFKYKIISVRRD